MAMNCLALGILGDRFSSTEVDNLLKFDPSITPLQSDNDASNFFSFFTQSASILIRRLGVNQCVANSCAFLDSIIICSSATAYLEQAITESCLAHLNSNGVYARQLYVVAPKSTSVGAFVSFLQRQLKRSGAEMMFPVIRVFEGVSVDHQEIMQTAIGALQLESRSKTPAPVVNDKELVVQQNGCRLFVLAKSSALKEVYVRVIAGSLGRGSTIQVPNLGLHFSVGHVSCWSHHIDARAKSGKFGVGSVCAIKIRGSENSMKLPTISRVPIDTLVGFGLARGSVDGHFLKCPRFVAVRIPDAFRQDGSRLEDFLSTIQGISLNGLLFYKAEIVTCDTEANVALIKCVPSEPEQLTQSGGQNRSKATFSRSHSPLNTVVCRTFRSHQGGLFKHDYLEVTSVIPFGFLLEKIVQCFSWFDSRSKRELDNFLDCFLGASTLPAVGQGCLKNVPLSNQDIIQELMCSVPPLCEGLTAFAFLTRYSVQCLDTGFITKWGNKIFVPLLHGFDLKAEQETRRQCISIVSDPAMLALVIRAVDVSCIPEAATSILGPLVVAQWLSSVEQKPAFVQSLVDRCSFGGGFDADEGEKLAIQIKQLRRETLKPFGKLVDQILWCIRTFTVTMWDATGCAPDHTRKLRQHFPALRIEGWTVQKYCAIGEILQGVPSFGSRIQIVTLIASYL